MLHRITFRISCLILLLLVPLNMPSAAGRAARPLLLHLRRATFDPLQQVPTLAADMRADNTRLRLLQFAAPIDSPTLARLRATGVQPLAYVPDQALIVRVADGTRAQDGVRWAGPFEPAYKLAASLDAALGSATRRDVTLVATPDADLGALAAAVRAAGGAVQRADAAPSGARLRALLPGAALRALLQRDDLLWAEPSLALRVQDDKATVILGVPEARRALGLTGAGQIVAVTDTGLDVQSSLNADFAGRVARGFGREELLPGCLSGADSNTWSDLNGHGTHVAGIIAGSGALSGGQYAGVAPEARLVVQAVATYGEEINCLPSTAAFLQGAYDAGARIQNASWGGSVNGAYTSLTSEIDDFIWLHQDHLFVTVAGNAGKDANRDGVIDGDSLDQPGTAKNIMSVGASENNRPPTGGCGNSDAAPQNFCWGGHFGIANVPPFSSAFVSDNPDGMAAFSGRGPTDDGRIKPEIVAPGTNIISARAHTPSAVYTSPLNADYAYESGTSSAAPMISGLAALLRQWLAQQRGVDAPSAALVKALLLNGATNIAPGQYGTGAQREIPAAWPNNVEGWGRASISATVGLGRAPVWFADEQIGIAANAVLTYTINVSASQPLRMTLVWTDPPATPVAKKTLVNDLDLELVAPDGTTTHGNAQAELPAACRDPQSGADRCNNAESIAIAAPQLGAYTVRVRAQTVSPLWGARQPFALAASTAALGTPILQPPNNGGRDTFALRWGAVSGATRYEVQQRTITSTAALSTSYALTGTAALSASYTLTGTLLALSAPVGRYAFTVRACDANGCGAFSAPLDVEVRDLRWLFLPLVGR